MECFKHFEIFKIVLGEPFLGTLGKRFVSWAVIFTIACSVKHTSEFTNVSSLQANIQTPFPHVRYEFYNINQALSCKYCFFREEKKCCTVLNELVHSDKNETRDSERSHFTGSVFFSLCPGRTRLSFGAILVYCVTSSSRAIHNRHHRVLMCVCLEKINV